MASLVLCGLFVTEKSKARVSIQRRDHIMQVYFQAHLANPIHLQPLSTMHCLFGYLQYQTQGVFTSS
jgi:hypothetical protein